MKRLAQIAYSDLPEIQRRHYILEDFTQSLNDLSLHHHLQAKGVTTIEAALQEGEAYLQAQRLCEAAQTPQQVTRLREPPPPVSGRSPVGLADQSSDGNNLHCLSRTASASYRKRSWLAR